MKKTTKNSRREFLTKAAMATAATVGYFSFNSKNSLAQNDAVLSLLADESPFKLPPLPYGYNALEPYIDAKTMEIHYTKHHQAYIDKLNAAVEKNPELKGKSVQELVAMIDKSPEAVKSQIRNQGGGHWNHSFFWQILAPKSEVMPSGKLKDAMISKWQSMDAFKEEFNKAGLGVFGSGWVWLITDQSGKLSIVTTANQDNTLMDIAKEKGKPVLGIDVWEHAYYLKHQNKRAEYLTDIWNVVNWKKVMELYG